MTQCGTPEYLAPEIVLGQPYDHSVDWYALGIMIYELIYGHSPFIANCPKETFNLIINSHSKRTGIKYPENFDKDAKKFVKELCRYDP